jgi:ribonuclease P protein component
MRQTVPARVRTHQSQPLKRILKTRDFKRAYRLGARTREGSLKIYVAANQSEYARLGVVVSKRVSKKAVVRNRIKRIIRAHISQCLPSSLKNSHDIVVVAQPGLTDKNTLSLALRANIKTALSRWPF